MSTVRRAASNLGWLSTAQILARVGGLAITAYLARYLGNGDFGTYTLCISFAGMLAVLARLGVRQIVLREIILRPEESSRYISTAVTSHVAQGVFAWCTITATAWLMGYRGDKLHGIMIIGVSSVFLAYEGLFNAVFEARERMAIKAKLILLRQLLWTILAIALVQAGRSYLSLLAALSLTAIIIAAIAAWVVFRHFHRFHIQAHLPTLKHLLRAGLPLAGAAVLVDIYLKVDMVMLDQLRTDTEVGYYAASYRLIQSLLFLSGAFFTVVYPIFSRLHRDDPDRLAYTSARSIKAISIALVPICAGLSALSVPVMRLIYGEDFLPGASALAIAVWGVAVQGLAAVMGRLIVAMQHQIYILYISAASVVMNVLLNFLLIPHLGISGAALASVITLIVVAALNYATLVRILEPLPLGRLLWRIFLAGGLMAFCVAQLQDRPLWQTVPLGAVLYVGLLWAFRVLDEDDKNLLRRLRKKES